MYDLNLYDNLGKFLVWAILFSVIFILIAFYISLTRFQKYSFFAAYAAKIMDFFYKPLLAIYLHVYKNPDKLHKKMADLKNNAQRSKFSKTTNRIILAPHCMRHPDCKARTTITGIQCTSCGKCDFAEIKKISEAHGYKLYIITGSSFVKHILKHPEAKETDGVLAIGCNYEINKGMRELKKRKLVTYGVPLLSNGCFNTKIDLEKFEQQLIAFDSEQPVISSNILPMA